MVLVSRNKMLKILVGCLNNPQGSALIIALIVMAVLTLVGLSVINTATVENKIVGNERIYQENYYLAESSVNEAIQKISSASVVTDIDKLVPPPASWSASWNWMHDAVDSSGNPVDFTDPDNWTNPEQAAVSDHAFYAAVYKGETKKIWPMEGHSLDIGDTTTRWYEYAVFGHGKSNNGSVIIEIGYLKPF